MSFANISFNIYVCLFAADHTSRRNQLTWRQTKDLSHELVRAASTKHACKAALQTVCGCADAQIKMTKTPTAK